MRRQNPLTPRSPIPGAGFAEKRAPGRLKGGKGFRPGGGWVRGGEPVVNRAIAPTSVAWAGGKATGGRGRPTRPRPIKSASIPPLERPIAMCKLRINLVAMTVVVCLAPSVEVKAFPFSSPAGATSGIELFHEAACPPWYRGLRDVAPFVCAEFWGWPRYYYRSTIIYHRYRHLRRPVVRVLN